MTADGSDRHSGTPRSGGPQYDAVRIDAPRFDVVLRGYDRRQVDEHLVRLARVVSRMRSDLEAASGALPAPPLPARSRPTPRPRPDGPPDRNVPPGQNTPDVVDSFTNRMQTILQAAEEEATEIRAKAQAGAKADVRAEEERLARLRAEGEKARATVMGLIRQRDAVLADLSRMRGQLEALLSAPTTRIAVPSQESASVAADRRDIGAGRSLPGALTPPPGPGVAGAEIRTDPRPVTSDAPAETAGPPGHGPGAVERTMVTAAAGTPPAESAPADAVPADPVPATVDETVKVGAVGQAAPGGPAPRSGPAPAAEGLQDGGPERSRPERASASTSR